MVEKCPRNPFSTSFCKPYFEVGQDVPGIVFHQGSVNLGLPSVKRNVGVSILLVTPRNRRDRLKRFLA